MSFFEGIRKSADALVVAELDQAMNPNPKIDALNPLRWARSFGIASVEAISPMPFPEPRVLAIVNMESFLKKHAGCLYNYGKPNDFQIGDKLQIIQVSLKRDLDTTEIHFINASKDIIIPHHYYLNKLNENRVLNDKDLTPEVLNKLPGARLVLTSMLKVTSPDRF